MFKFKTNSFVKKFNNTIEYIKDFFEEYAHENIAALLVCVMVSALSAVVIFEKSKQKQIDTYRVNNNVEKLFETKAREYLSRFQLEPNFVVCANITEQGLEKFISTCKYCTKTDTTMLKLSVHANFRLVDSLEIKSWEFYGL